MAANPELASGKRGNPWRPVIWGGAACLLLLPLVAMQFTPEVNWTGFDFLVFGSMLSLACGSYELGAKMSSNTAYRAATAVAVGAGFMLTWINLAVGVIGDEGDPANLLFAAVLLVGIIGALLGRFRAQGMARALVATAAAQALVGVVVLLVGVIRYEALALCAVFTVIWLVSAGLFSIAARTGPQVLS